MAKKTIKKGYLITFEGPEGSGKSTQACLLCAHLRRKGLKVIQLREPGSTKIGEQIREILLNTKNKKMDVVCEMLLYQAARAQLIKEKIQEALLQKKVVVLDRFLDATVCYQGYGAGISVNEILHIGKIATYGIVPDVTILLDVEVKQGLKRAKRGDRMEKKPIRFHQKVRRGYLTLAARNKKRVKVVPVSLDIVQTQVKVQKIIERSLKI